MDHKVGLPLTPLSGASHNSLVDTSPGSSALNATTVRTGSSETQPDSSAQIQIPTPSPELDFPGGTRSIDNEAGQVSFSPEESQLEEPKLSMAAKLSAASNADSSAIAAVLADKSNILASQRSFAAKAMHEAERSVMLDHSTKADQTRVFRDYRLFCISNGIPAFPIREEIVLLALSERTASTLSPDTSLPA